MGLLEGKTALVTGGSAGIGLASALRLAAEGAHVLWPEPDLTGGTTHGLVEEWL